MPSSNKDNAPPATEAALDASDSGLPPLKSRVLILVAIGVAVFLSSLDATIVATITPTLTNEFKSVKDIGWYGSAYLLVTGAVLPVTGKIYTMFPQKPVFLGCVLLLGMGSLMCALAKNSNTFIAGRAVAGLGSAGLFSGALIISASVTPLHARPVALGIIGSLEGVSLIVGPVIGGAIATSIGWRWCFWINLPSGVVLSAILSLLFHPPRHSSAAVDKGQTSQPFSQKLKQVDFVGAVLITGGLTCLLLALQAGGSEHPWSSAPVLAPLIVFAVLAVIVPLHQRWKGEAAIFPTRLLKNKGFVACLLYSLCIASSQFVMLSYLPIWFQAVQGTTAQESGIRTLPLVLSVISLAVAAGIAVAYVGYLPPFMIGATILTSVGAGLLHTLSPSISQAKWIGYQILYGSGSGVGIQQAIAGVQLALPAADVAYGTSAIMTMNTVGGAIFICVAQKLFYNEIIKLAGKIPGLDAQALGNGAWTSGWNGSREELAILAEGYNYAIVRAFLITLGLCCASTAAWPFFKWTSIRKKPAKTTDKDKPAEIGAAADNTANTNTGTSVMTAESTEKTTV